MKVLITGGAGYIGSTVALALEDSGHIPVILDSLVMGRREYTRDRIFYQGDIADKVLLKRIFDEHPDIMHTIHCAALIVVPESVERPYHYYHENVAKSLELFINLAMLGRPNILFSSSASIYDQVPGYMVTESSPFNPQSPYARTKYMVEMILKDMCHAYDLRGVSLRYFNPIGADPGMRSGPYVKEASHVLAKMVAVAAGREETFYITGTNWPTRDGSGIRDYIHIWDLAQAHVAAITQFDAIFERVQSEGNDTQYAAINLGTGTGVTVIEILSAFERIYGQPIHKATAPPRAGDVAGAYANADTALRLLGWKAELTIEQGISDALEWERVKQKVLAD